jgi:hypothetical protein
VGFFQASIEWLFIADSFFPWLKSDDEYLAPGTLVPEYGRRLAAGATTSRSRFLRFLVRSRNAVRGARGLTQPCSKMQ